MKALVRSGLAAADVASVVELLWREESMNQASRPKRIDRGIIKVKEVA